MLPDYYEFFNPVKINAGNEALETIPYELKQMNVSRPIIITDKGISDAGLLKTLVDSFDDSELVIGVIYDETPPDSSLKTVNEIAKLYRKHKCDSIIALGGGSPMDTAKGVNIIISEQDDDLRKFMGADRLKAPQQPLIAAPTMEFEKAIPAIVDAFAIANLAFLSSPFSTTFSKFSRTNLMADVA